MPPRVAALGAELDHVVGGGDHRGVVLDDDQRVAALDQPIEHADEPRHVGEVEPGGRLVEHVERGLVARAGGELAGELEALGLAAGEGVRALAEVEVARRRDRTSSRAGRGCGGGRRRPSPPPRR